LLTEDRFDNRYNTVALRFSEQSNKIRPNNWMFLDTLALAKFVNGDAEAAIALEEQAIALANDRNRPVLEASLERFRKGMNSPEKID
jgi:acyl-homoserine lactone acylase PvdQ